MPLIGEAPHGRKRDARGGPDGCHGDTTAGGSTLRPMRDYSTYSEEEIAWRLRPWGFRRGLRLVVDEEAGGWRAKFVDSSGCVHAGTGATRREALAELAVLSRPLGQDRAA